MRVMTWNIHGAVGRDGKEDWGRIAAVIEAADVEVVGLQEVDCRRMHSDNIDKLTWLGRRLGMAQVEGPARWEAGGYFGNAVLSRRPVHRARVVDVSVARREQRSVLDVEVGAAPQAQVLRVLVTHFGLRARERNRQAKALLELAAEEPEVATIVMGDFNEWRPRASCVALLDSAFGRPKRTPRTFPARFPLLPLDRVWVRPLTALSDLRRLSGPAGLASDHLPVVVSLALHHSAR